VLNVFRSNRKRTAVTGYRRPVSVTNEEKKKAFAGGFPLATCFIAGNSARWRRNPNPGATWAAGRW